MKLKRVLSLLLAMVMTVSLLTLPVHAEGNDFASLTVAEQYAALKSADNEADAQALFDTLTEQQQTALVTYAQTQAEQEYTVPQTVVFTEAGPFMPPVNVAPVRMKTMARAAAASAEDDGNGLVFEKMATANGDGSYTITMEAYTTGEVITSTKTAPVDVIFIIDQSGSMAWNMGGSNTSNDEDRRITIVKDLMKDFLDKTVAKTKDGSGNVTAHHRIAVVGFSSNGYNNNELLTGVTIKNNNGAQYGDITDAMYAAALQDVSTAAGQQNVQNAIDALTANGGTQPNYGLEIAQNVFKNDPGVTGETDRQRVVIFLTDGVPDGIGSTAGGHEVAENAVKAAYPLKGTYGATVYTIGIFAGADPTHIGVTGTPMLNEDENDRANRFMNLASSNYPTANSFYLRIVEGIVLQYRWLADVPPRAEGDYYLSANNKEELTRIFTTISEQIQTANIDLGSETVIKDEISPYFTAPAKASDIHLYTAEAKSDGTFKDRVAAPDTVTATVKDDTVSVTGFNFNDNFVSDKAKSDGSYGKKLIIEFTVTPKAGFLGGNNVPTNGEAAVYDKDGTMVEAVGTPHVNVTIANPVFTVNNKTIYQGNSIALSELYTLPAYTGADDWKDDFVTITANTGSVTGTVSPTDCTNYDISVTYAPSEEAKPDSVGTPNNTQVTTQKSATVHVLQPTITATINDVERYYGESYTLGNGANGAINLDWTDKNDHSTIPAVTGSAPYTESDLSLAYSTAAFSDQTGTVPASDFDVTVKVMKGDTVMPATITTTCTHGCGADQTDGKYTVHVKTCTLTIKKSGCDTDKDANQSFIFDVTGPKTMQVTVQENGTATIVGLPVGDYTVTEDGDWSWRYKADGPGKVTLSAAKHTDTVTITNDRTATKWLSGDNYAVNHVGGIKAQGTFVGA